MRTPESVALGVDDQAALDDALVGAAGRAVDSQQRDVDRERRSIGGVIGPNGGTPRTRRSLIGGIGRGGVLTSVGPGADGVTGDRVLGVPIASAPVVPPSGCERVGEDRQRVLVLKAGVEDGLELGRELPAESAARQARARGCRPLPGKSSEARACWLARLVDASAVEGDEPEQLGDGQERIAVDLDGRSPGRWPRRGRPRAAGAVSATWAPEPVETAASTRQERGGREAQPSRRSRAGDAPIRVDLPRRARRSSTIGHAPILPCGQARVLRSGTDGVQRRRSGRRSARPSMRASPARPNWAQSTMSSAFSRASTTTRPDLGCTWVCRGWSRLDRARSRGSATPGSSRIDDWRAVYRRVADGTATAEDRAVLHAHACEALVWRSGLRRQPSECGAGRASTFPEPLFPPDRSDIT